MISGGNFKPDTLKPKEVVSLLLDDEELEKKCKLLHNLYSFCKSRFTSITSIYTKSIIDNLMLNYYFFNIYAAKILTNILSVNRNIQRLKILLYQTVVIWPHIGA